jgi:YD repeat-containing protein
MTVTIFNNELGMNKNKRLTLVVFGMLAVLSCSKNDPVVVNGCLITKMTTTVTSSGQVSTTVTDLFEYDSDRRLVKVTETNVSSGSTTSNLIQTYTYAQGMVSTAKTEGTTGGSTISVTTTWTNDNGHVTKITGTAGGLSTFGYDGAGNLKTFNYTDGKGQQTSLSATYSTELQSVTAVSSGINVAVTYGAHDSKINPLILLAKAINQPCYVSGTGLINSQYLHKANPLSERDVLTFGGISNTLDLTFSYTYNSRNYPITAKQQLSGTDQSALVVFEYKDCN